jgi:hypothetical protein
MKEERGRLKKEEMVKESGRQREKITQTNTKE